MSELTTSEAVGLLETEGVNVAADTLRALAKTNRIAARKEGGEGGEWRFPETVVSDVQRVQEEESQPEEAEPEEGSGGDGSGGGQKYDQAAEEGRRQAERESDPGRNARLDAIFGR